MNTNILWMLIGIIIGSSVIIGTQFVSSAAKVWAHNNLRLGAKLQQYVNSTKEWDDVEAR